LLFRFDISSHEQRPHANFMQSLESRLHWEWTVCMAAGFSPARFYEPPA